MTKSPEAAIETMIANLCEKTGKPFEHWIKVARQSGFSKHGEVVKFLKAEHEFTHGYANLVAQRALAQPAGEVDLVEAQYQGARAALRPIHDALVAAAVKFGKDVEVAPKKTCVSLRRARQFALIQPASNTRVDLGLKLEGVPLGGRLEAWPSTMCTHRVRLESIKDIDRELLGLLKQAFTQSG